MDRLHAYDHLLWDFNGTILDDVWVGIRAVNKLLARRGLPLIADLASYYAVFGFPIRDYYVRLGFDFSVEPYEQVAVEWVEEYRREERLATLRPGVLQLMAAADRLHLPQSILSATEEKMLGEQLSDLGIAERFRHVIGRGDIYAADKSALAVQWKQRYSPGRVLLIGDTDHDYHAATAAGFDCVLVGGGHQDARALRRLGCPVYDDMNTLIAALGEEVEA